MEGQCGKKEGHLNEAHPFPRVWGYKRGSNIMEGNIVEVRVYINKREGGGYMTI